MGLQWPANWGGWFSWNTWVWAAGPRQRGGAERTAPALPAAAQQAGAPRCRRRCSAGSWFPPHLVYTARVQCLEANAKAYSAATVLPALVCAATNTERPWGRAG